MSESFLGRWSRLKADERRKAGAAALVPPPDEAAVPAPDEAAVPAPAVEPEAPEDIVAALPPIESLTKDSDFTAFLKAGVPEELKNAALRRLWRSDPTLAGPELLDLHNLDYTFPAVPELVRTAYQVGKGFVDALDEAGKAGISPTGPAGEPSNDRAVAEGGDAAAGDPEAEAGRRPPTG
jgi:hypothetical protein